MWLGREHPPPSVTVFGDESEAAADRCDRTGAPKARKPSERSEHRRLRLNKQQKILPQKRAFTADGVGYLSMKMERARVPVGRVASCKGSTVALARRRVYKRT